LRANKAGNDEILERLPGHRDCFQGVEVEIEQTHVTGFHSGGIAAF